MFKSYLNDNNGNFATWFAIALLPLIWCIGVAVDLSRLTHAKSELQDAADSAALSAAAAMQQGNTNAYSKLGKQTFQNNLSGHENLRVTNFVLTSNNSTVRVESKAKLQPMFIQVFGFPKLDVAVHSQATTGTTIGAEIAIAIDSTNSMSHDTRWDTAMTSIENILGQMKASAGASEFYISMVPFSDRVNIGTPQAHWLDGPAPVNWTGCTEPREEVKGGYNWMLDDDRHSMEPFTASENTSVSCPATPITSPTSDPAILVADLKSLTPSGSGRLDVGLAWASRLLSPKWAGDWSMPGYPTSDLTKRQKYLIFITDGHTTMGESELSQEVDWGWNNGSKVLFEHIEEQCRNIKDDGVQIFMLQVSGNDHATPYFERCASTPDHFYRIDAPEDISNAFADLLSQFNTDVRILR